MEEKKMCDKVLSCSECAVRACGKKMEEKYPDFCLTKNMDDSFLEETLKIYDNELEHKIAVESARIEGENYCKLTRVEETVLFIEKMGFKKVGIATCVGLLNEAKTFVKILNAHGIETYTACCKIGAVDKSRVGVPDGSRMDKGCGHESMCNPIMQAKALEAAGTDFNVVIGLCVGHDTLFMRHTNTPCTVLVVKDRVLCHNPVAALYQANTGYSRFKKELNN